jgi:hypothetical protein
LVSEEEAHAVAGSFALVAWTRRIVDRVELAEHVFVPGKVAPVLEGREATSLIAQARQGLSEFFEKTSDEPKHVF